MAIRENNGQYQHQRTQEEAIKLLMDDIDSLSPEELQLLRLAIAEMQDPTYQDPATRPTRIIDALSESEYIRTPVDMDTFLSDPYYLGETANSLFPVFRKDLAELFSGGYRQVCVTGAIGIGKSFLGSIIFLRMLYEMSCMRDIHRSFGISKGSNISLVALSVNQELAQKVIFENVATKLEMSPYFKEVYPYEATKTEIRFANGIWIAARATTDTSALGLNVVAAMMDEGNFLEGIQRGKASMAKYGSKDKAQHLYDQLMRRMKSRFLKNGKLPGMMVLLSSKRTRDDFVTRIIKESMDDPETLVLDYALWDMKPKSYSQERFQVLVGNETTPSKIIPEEELEATKAKVAEKQDEGLYIIDVPEEFRPDFENDVDNAIRDIAGRETVSVSPFLQQRDKIEKCIDTTREHPFQVTSWDQTKPGTFNWKKMVHKVQVRDGGKLLDVLQPIHHPQYMRHIHIDPSLVTDATGLCMGCICGYKQVQRKNPETNEWTTESAPVFFIDFLLEVVPPMGGEIDHGEIRGLVYAMQDHGYHIGMVTMDQFNSAPTIQKFNSKGIRSERLSVDKPMDAYDTLKQALYEERVLMYRYEPLLDQLRKLQRDRIKNKVDHPPKGKKDVADALAGVVFSLSEANHHAPLMIMKGIAQHVNAEGDIHSDDPEPQEHFLPILL